MKNIHRWLGAYLSQCIRSHPMVDKPIHIMFACCDHFEPDWNKADISKQINRVQRWVQEYPKLVSQFHDADGGHPKQTFFYPAEVYRKENLELLESLVEAGLGEVEIHLHHDQDTEEGLKVKIQQAIKDFTRHGFLGQRKLSGQIRFAFIHGNWALNNSRKDGRWCGVNNETKILHNLGCYADFTYPSAPSETQPRKINSIYYSNSNSLKPKGHNKGINVEMGKYTSADVMHVQGPLALNWRNRSRGIFPRIENGDITGHYHPTKDRVDLWVKQHICVAGKEDWIFIKTHTHGAKEFNADTLLGEPMKKMYEYLLTRYNDKTKYIMHFVTAREMYNIIKAAEAGEIGSPSQYRDYLVVRNKK